MTGKSALILITAINLLNYIDRYIIAAVMPQMSLELALSDTQAGVIMSAFMFGYFITSPVFGYLADRYSRRKIIGIGTVMWSLFTGLAGLAKNFPFLFYSRIAVGVGEAATVSTSQSLLADYFPKEKRNQVMAIFSAAIPVGAALGFVIGGIVAHQYGWRYAFFFAGILGLLLAMGLFFLKEPKRGGFDSDRSSKPASDVKSDFFQLVKNKTYLLTVLGYTAFTFTVGGLATWVPQYLVRIKNIPLKEADSVFGLITVCTGTLGTLLGGYLAARALKKRARGDMGFIFWLTVIAIPITFACFFTTDKITFYILLALSEFLLFGTQPTVAVVIVESVRPEIRSLALAFSVFAIHLMGDLISPPLVGVLSDHFGLNLGILILPLALIPSAVFYGKCYKNISKNTPVAEPIR